MSTNRRDFIKTAAAAGSALALGLGAEACATPGTPKPLKILILGGTTFLGPHMIKYALDRGHEVSIFTRGRTQPTIYRSMYREVEQLVGDRASDHTALEGRTWDVVLDTSGFRLEWAKQSTQLLRDAAEVYVYTSSTGVYLPYLGTDIKEDTKLIPADPNTHRFPYWPVRMARGGEVLLPGSADHLVQYIDVRDLTEWMVRLAETRTAGTFNVAGPASPIGGHEFAYRIHAATSSDVSWIKIPDYEFLREHGVRGMVPWLMPSADYAGAARINLDHSKANGLTFRQLTQTSADVLEWWDSDAVTDERRLELTDGDRSMIRREPEIIAAWKAR